MFIEGKRKELPSPKAQEVSGQSLAINISPAGVKAIRRSTPNAMIDSNCSKPRLIKARPILARLILLMIILPVCWLGIATSAARRIPPQGKAEQPAAASEIDLLVQTAYGLYQQGKYAEALAKCSQAMTLNPNDFRPHGIAGLAWMAQWKMKSASTEFATVIRLQPQRKEFYVLKAKADISLGAVDEAIAGCRKAIELDPNFGDVYATIGEALEHNEKRQAEAIAAYQTALKVDPKLFAVYESLGWLFVNMKDEKKAEEIYRQGMAADPRQMAGRFPLGRLFVTQGKLVEARQLWDARSSDEDHLQPTFIQLLTRAENMKRATENLAQKPNDPNALLEMGLAVMDGDSWVVDGRQERAIVYFRKALAIQPGFVLAQYNVVKAMVQSLGRDDKRVTQELAKLRKLDAALAKEMEEYRKSYEGGLIGMPIDTKPMNGKPTKRATARANR